MNTLNTVFLLLIFFGIFQPMVSMQKSVSDVDIVCCNNRDSFKNLLKNLQTYLEVTKAIRTEKKPKRISRCYISSSEDIFSYHVDQSED